MRFLLKFHFLSLAMMASAGALVIALIAQYGYGLYPCEICSYQRIPYGGVLLFGGCAVAIGGWKRSHISYLFSVIFLCSAALAFYHTGIEQHWWRAATSCGGHQPMPSSLTELNLSLANAIPKACDEIDWTLLGLPMSVYNIVVSLMLSILGLLSARINQSGAI
jgi:disulfide bond formation protein DsbB